MNLYGFVSNGPVSSFDIYGMLDYKIGEDDPPYTPDQGLQGRIPATNDVKQAKEALTGIILPAGASYLPNAVDNLNHYFANTKSEKIIKFGDLVKNTADGRKHWLEELNAAIAFAESLPLGEHGITSGKFSDGYVSSKDNLDWYLAVAGYKSWGKAKISCAGPNKIKMTFYYQMRDRYNWDGNKSIDINSFLNKVPDVVKGQLGNRLNNWKFGSFTLVENGQITDSTMALFHLMGLAQEFDMRGQVEKTFEWEKGKSGTLDKSPP